MAYRYPPPKKGSVTPQIVLGDVRAGSGRLPIVLWSVKFRIDRNVDKLLDRISLQGDEIWNRLPPF